MYSCEKKIPLQPLLLQKKVVPERIEPRRHAADLRLERPDPALDRADVRLEALFLHLGVRDLPLERLDPVRVRRGPECGRQQDHEADEGGEKEATGHLGSPS